MKNIKLFLDFFSQNKIKMLAIFIVMSSAMVLLANTIIQNNYYQYTTSFFCKDELKDTIFVQAAYVFELSLTDEDGNLYEDHYSEEYQTKYQEIKEQLSNEPIPQKTQEFSAVDNVYYSYYTLGEYYTDDISVEIAPNDTYQVFDLMLSDGTWFQNCEQESEYPNAVLCGNIYKDVKIGEDIEITINGQNLKVHTIGKVQAPYYTIDVRLFSDSASNMTFNTSAYTKNRVFLLNNDFTQSVISKLNIHLFTDGSFFVSFKDSATQEEKDDYFDYISQYGGQAFPAYLDTNTIVENTIQDNQNRLLSSLPLSLFYMVIATFMMICIATIVAKKKLMEHYTYYLCGCSRKRSFLLLLSGLAAVGILSALIAFLYLIFSNYMVSLGIQSHLNILVDGSTYLYIFLYMLLIVLISLIIAFFSIRKYTPIELYRSKGQ